MIKLIPMRNVSPNMQERFRMLNELISGKYIEPVKLIHPTIPLCLIPKTTSNYPNAPEHLKQEYQTKAISWYAFFLAPFAYVQTSLELAYIPLALIFITIISLVPPTFPRAVYSLIEILMNIFFSMFFIYSRYYQYETRRIPKNRTTFLTIVLGVVITLGCAMPGALLRRLLYSSYFEPR